MRMRNTKRTWVLVAAVTAAVGLGGTGVALAGNSTPPANPVVGQPNLPVQNQVGCVDNDPDDRFDQDDRFDRDVDDRFDDCDDRFDDRDDVVDDDRFEAHDDRFDDDRFDHDDD